VLSIFHFERRCRQHDFLRRDVIQPAHETRYVGMAAHGRRPFHSLLPEKVAAPADLLRPFRAVDGVLQAVPDAPAGSFHAGGAELSTWPFCA
jgi:hypothetical protein